MPNYRDDVQAQNATLAQRALTTGKNINDIRKETRGISAMVIARITFCTLARVNAMSAMASRIGGIDIKPSMTRMTVPSSARR